ncbi:hypothetical protein EQG63_10375 [Flavobacterium amnicola]|uniref:Signal transduction histidine kinase internal region domain-containing protein n=1 Tax=Flavobacterium amnicola TaxID=2506422 RepID=A0A4Q1K282_9FLAO|nr:histidine kinase [Flavobacterium amnicola]RXR17879.1 hypothetical protein EQG63_10375 [Flavobacterium amnicola]
MLIKKYFLILILFPLSLFSQELYKVAYERKDGLPTTNFYSSLSAKDGSLWFASDMGVLKYDGYSFKQYDSQNGLADDENFNFFQDKSGRIWFYSYNGKISFLENGEFYNDLKYPFLRIRDNIGFIVSITENNDGSFDIIYSKGALLNLNLKNKRLTPVRTNTIFNYKYSLGRSNYYITPNAINDESFKKVASLGIPNFNTLTFARYCKWKNNLFLSQGNSIYRIENFKCKKVIELTSVSNEIIHLYIDSLNKLWVGTRLGVYVYDINNFKKIPEHYFANNAISSINEDFEGKIWLTTLDNGIYYIPNRNTKIIKNKGEDLKVTSLGISTNNAILGGTSLDKYFSISNSLLVSKFDLHAFQAKNNISQIIQHNNSNYIVGKHGIRIISKYGLNDIPFIGSKCLLFESDSVWVGATYLLKIAQKDLVHLKNKDLLSTDSRVVLTQKTNCIVPVNNAKWIGTNNGLYTIENGKMEEISTKFPNIKTIISDILYLENQKTILVSTNNKGIFVFKNKQLVKHFTTKNGLLSNTIHRLRKNNSHSVFICTNQGLNNLYFEKDLPKISNLNKYIGFENFKINDILSRNNLLYLATENGLLYLPMESLQFKPVLPKITVDLLEVNNLKKKPLELQHLSHKENNIKIGYSGISFQSQKSINYLYRLRGNESTWQTSTARELNYKSLAPGHYTFEIKAVNGSNTSSELISIPIIIQKPFWKTIWFIVTVIIFSALVTLLLWKKRLKNLEQKFEQERHQIQMERDKANLEKQMIELEQKALRMQMNPHFIFNALNTIKGYYAEGNDEKASDYISKFSMLLRLLLENSEQLIPLSTEVSMLQLYLELTQIRYKNTFTFSIITNNIKHPEDTAIPPLLLQPMVENAVIHGLAPKETKGALQITFTKENDWLVCKVQDNGIGLRAAAEKHQIKHHESKAIAITKERVALLNESIDNHFFAIKENFDSSNNSLGTEVIIKIPFKTIW